MILAVGADYEAECHDGESCRKKLCLRDEVVMILSWYECRRLIDALCYSAGVSLVDDCRDCCSDE